ncbi:Aromatic/aminoadipate aminotransferase 1 [Lasiodiplodia theobromae]|uniref:Aromatic/aminoadipate aminotransferase 1 n=1 Tax=Lasiodiplodia theobromae TaxID=45133 RepID=A0A5N5CVU0_9PEZI|nr:Aromatic/aminoadipate aminotransferase 1 [Lasiodiplodia theobromae]
MSDYFPLETISLTVLPSSLLPLQDGNNNNNNNNPATPATHHLHATKHDLSNNLSTYDLSTALNYSQGSGSAPLLRWLTEHTELLHNPPYADWACTMTIGNTSALDMLLRMFARRGDAVLADAYTFSSAVEAAAPMGVRFVGVDMDEQGMVPGSLRQVLETWEEGERGGARRPFLLYTVPTGQNPTGVTQGVQRRREIYRVAQEWDLIVLEDDPYYFLQLGPYAGGEDGGGGGAAAAAAAGGPPRSPEELLERLVPSYLSMDTDGRVVRMDSFSKVVFPGARVGWITASQQIVEQYKHHADVSTQSPAGLSQLALFKLLDEHWGHAGYLSWLLHLRSEYTKRRDFAIEACERYLPAGIVSWKPAEAGMFQWLKVDCSSHPHVKSKTAAEIEEEIWLESIKQGALVARGSWFRVPDGRPQRDVYFRITFAAASLDKIAEAVKRFGNAVDELFHAE